MGGHLELPIFFSKHFDQRVGLVSLFQKKYKSYKKVFTVTKKVVLHLLHLFAVFAPAVLSVISFYLWIDSDFEFLL